MTTNEERAREAGESCDHVAIGTIAACVPCIAAALAAAEARGREQQLPENSVAAMVEASGKSYIFLPKDDDYELTPEQAKLVWAFADKQKFYEQARAEGVRTGREKEREHLRETFQYLAAEHRVLLEMSEAELGRLQRGAGEGEE